MTETCFQLSATERLQALLGGIVHVRVRIVAMPGASELPTEIEKRVEWPWRKSA